MFSISGFLDNSLISNTFRFAKEDIVVLKLLFVTQGKLLLGLKIIFHKSIELIQNLSYLEINLIQLN